MEHTRNQEINIRRQMEAERSRREHEMARRLQEIRERETRYSTCSAGGRRQGDQSRTFADQMAHLSLQLLT